jgi:WhiB family redox-sensing transcriptional regulator
MVNYEFPRDALCRGMDTNIFYPVPGDEVGVAVAKGYCALCPVAAECLAFALAHEDVTDGIFGGTTGAERDRLLRRTA